MLLKIAALLMVACLAYGEETVDYVTKIKSTYSLIYGTMYSVSLSNSFLKYSVDTNTTDITVLRYSYMTAEKIKITYDPTAFARHYLIITKAEKIPPPAPPASVVHSATVPVNVEK